MELIALVAGEERPVQVEALGADRYRVTLAGEVHELEAYALGAFGMGLLAPDRAHEVTLVPGAGGPTQAFVGSQRVEVEILGLRQMQLRRGQRAGARATGPHVVRAPMPGRVVAVLVAAGQAVTEGAGLVVVEAMKMENELRAPRAGVVQDIEVQVGTVVDHGAPLCTVV